MVLLPSHQTRQQQKAKRMSPNPGDYVCLAALTPNKTATKSMLQNPQNSDALAVFTPINAATTNGMHINEP